MPYHAMPYLTIPYHAIPLLVLAGVGGGRGVGAGRKSDVCAPCVGAYGGGGRGGGLNVRKKFLVTGRRIGGRFRDQKLCCVFYGISLKLFTRLLEVLRVFANMKLKFY